MAPGTRRWASGGSSCTEWDAAQLVLCPTAHWDVSEARGRQSLIWSH